MLKINPFKKKRNIENVDWMLPTIYELLDSNQKRQVRNQYARDQRGLCHHCRKSLAMEPTEVMMKFCVNPTLFPDGFFDNPIHLHHDHETGLTIGTVHAYCNAVLWQYHGE